MVIVARGTLILGLLWAASLLCGFDGYRQALRIGDGRAISLDRMIQEVRRTPLIFVGEEHDRPESHAVELEVIKGLHETGVPLVIGVEMFTARRQEELDRWVAGTMTLPAFIEAYQAEWDFPWSLYQDIFLYARDHHIPVVGLNIPREIIRKVAQEGFSALGSEERRRIPEGISCAVDPAYTAFIRDAFAMHTGHGSSFTHFCEAQMLWNKSMGRHIDAYLAKHPQRTMVVLAGTGHVLKRGIPDEVTHEQGTERTVIIPESPYLTRSVVTAADADYLVMFDRTAPEGISGRDVPPGHRMPSSIYPSVTSFSASGGR